MKCYLSAWDLKGKGPCSSDEIPIRPEHNLEAYLLQNCLLLLARAGCGVEGWRNLISYGLR